MNDCLDGSSTRCGGVGSGGADMTWVSSLFLLARWWISRKPILERSGAVYGFAVVASRVIQYNQGEDAVDSEEMCNHPQEKNNCVQKNRFGFAFDIPY